MKYEANSYSFNGIWTFRRGYWMAILLDIVRQKPLLCTTINIVALNFLLCLHYCIANENKRRSANDNY